jgi:hypothetical protein
MVKGASGSPVVDRMAIVVALACAFLRTRVWFEYIQSDSNWSDGASRKLDLDVWCQTNHFELAQMDLLEWVITSPTPALWEHTEGELRASLG